MLHVFFTDHITGLRIFICKMHACIIGLSFFELNFMNALPMHVYQVLTVVLSLVLCEVQEFKFFFTSPSFMLFLMHIVIQGVILPFVSSVM